MQTQSGEGGRGLGAFPRETCTVRVERVVATPGRRGGGRGPGVCVPPERVVEHLRRVEPGRYRLSCLDGRRHFVKHGALVVEVDARGSMPRRAPPKTPRDYERRAPRRRRELPDARAEGAAMAPQAGPDVTGELARLRRELARRDRRIQPVKRVRAELRREHRSRLRTLERHFDRAVAQRDQARREVDALRAELDGARREVEALSARHAGASREADVTRAAQSGPRGVTSPRVPTSAASPAPAEERGQQVDLSGLLGAELHRARATILSLRADLARVGHERAIEARRAESARQKVLVLTALLTRATSTPPRLAPVVVAAPYPWPVVSFAARPAVLAPASDPAASIASSHEATPRDGGEAAPAAVVELEVLTSATSAHVEEARRSERPRSSARWQAMRAMALVSMWLVEWATARHALGAAGMRAGWRWLLAVWLASTLLMCAALAAERFTSRRAAFEHG